MNTETYYESKSEYLEKNPTWHEEDSPWKAANIMKMMKINNLTPETIVEIGCGAGEILNQLYCNMENEKIKFYGYEISPDAFQLAVKKENDRLKFYYENLLQKKVCYDLLLMIDVFEHVEGYYDFIKSSARKATYKIYHIPLAMSATSIVRNQPIQAKKKVGHLHHFMKDTALSLLEDTGQQIIDYFYTAGSLEHEQTKLRTKLLHMPRRILYNINKDFAVRLLGGFSLMVLTK